MVNLLSFNSLSLSEYSGTAIGLLSWVGLGVVSIRCLLASTAELTPAPVLCARPRVSIRCLLASTAELWFRTKRVGPVVVSIRCLLASTAEHRHRQRRCHWPSRFNSLSLSEYSGTTASAPGSVTGSPRFNSLTLSEYSGTWSAHGKFGYA